MLNGQRYMTDAELSQYLKLSRRTLQEYRNNGLVPYYQIGGKILYRESDIEELLERNRQEAFK
nr:helix-turn-helix domain-containing protein [Bacteroides nordii]